jgi:preprotein translocase subunit SecG
MSLIYFVALFLFMGLSGLLCLVILVQESKSLGLGASFGGDPGESLFGTSTAQVLKRFTAYVAAIFLFACIVLSIWTSHVGGGKTPAPLSIEESTD